MSATMTDEILDLFKGSGALLQGRFKDFLVDRTA
jgi:hypothetical protein